MLPDPAAEMCKEVPFSQYDLVKLLKILDDFDSSFDYTYQIHTWNGTIYLSINDSDLFAWGYYGEYYLAPSDIDALRQTYVDSEKVLPRFGSIHAPRLFCCRKSKWRPQGAAYPDEKELWPLFDACGPEREVGLGNPYKPGEYKSGKTSQSELMIGEESD